ncbi:aminotransferase class I/II-fold pyridoxal phosphate-dependent enzyme [Crenothrix polyspora]|uniref:Threonine-phosphate decarboxylase CobD n=1 Tax=Crenothrix polyspora TaxID=360316 RepID=A0A1R4HG53_9GAMM|nr:aminotransferase class I/II-fold pyridoxal phosphate-dependent enzyme [Crenothrix polyspora]SJM95213.1 Threonine-phosphate decarboxylase CobD [Crenothrix polyspora]
MHGGNIYQFAQRLGCLPEQVLDFSANINPQQALDVTCLHSINLSPYADPDYNLLKQAFKQRYPHSTDTDCEVFNGASAAIFALLRFLQPEQLVLYAPLYGEYARISQQLGCAFTIINRLQDKVDTPIPRGSTIVFVNPATPDGQLYDLQTLLLGWQQADCTVIIDESFLDFCTGAKSALTHINQHPKLYIIKSLSKFYGCAGIRVGFISATATAIKALKHYEPAWKLSTFDMAYMQRALANSDFISQTQQHSARLRELLYQALENSGLFVHIYPSATNFLLVRLAGDLTGDALQTALEPARILIRVCDSFVGLDKLHVRFAVKDQLSIQQLAHALAHV